MRHRVVLFVSALALLACAWPASAQTYSVQKPRRQFITLSYDWLYTQPLHFIEHPVEDLVGKEVAAAQFETFDYQTRDGTILIDVLEFKRRGHGAGITVYPFGLSVGATLGSAGKHRGSSGHPHRLFGRRRAADIRPDRRAGVRRVRGDLRGRSIDRLGPRKPRLRRRGHRTDQERRARRRSHLRRGRRRAQLRSDWRGAVDQVRLEPPDRSRRSPLHHRADYGARHGVFHVPSPWIVP